MRRALAIERTDDERRKLLQYSRGRSTPARLVLRAKIVLQAADGRENRVIAAALGTSRKTVGLWRTRFARQRLAGIQQDAPRPGRTPALSAEVTQQILDKTTQETPPNATHCSTRRLAKTLGISKDSVQRVWRAAGLQPHLSKTFKVSNDPRLAEKVVDIVGLHLDPPDQALVLSCDENSSIQALDRTQNSLPLFPGRLQTLTHDDKRNGTTTLFAAISVVDGLVISQGQPRHRHQEWLKFLKQIDAQTPPELDLP